MANCVRMAYLLQVHKNPDQVSRFIRQIGEDGDPDIYVHIDRKSGRAVLQGIPNGWNIKIMKESLSVTWGDISQVDATLYLLRNLGKSLREYDFVCFKSGQDLLVNKGLRDHLAKNKNKIFMNVKQIGNNDPRTYFWNLKWPRFTKARYDSVLHPYRIARSGLIRLYRAGINPVPNQNRLPDYYVLYRGSSWFIMPGEVADYIVRYLDQNQWYYEAFKDALCPDESFFQTLIMNSPYAGDVINDNLTYLRFGRSYRDNNHPVTLTIKDLPEIEASGKFFARKFDDDIDKEVIEYFCHKCRRGAGEKSPAE